MTIQELYQQANAGWKQFFAGRSFFCMHCGSAIIAPQSITTLVPMITCPTCTRVSYEFDPVQGIITTRSVVVDAAVATS